MIKPRPITAACVGVVSPFASASRITTFSANRATLWTRVSRRPEAVVLALHHPSVHALVLDEAQVGAGAVPLRADERRVPSYVCHPEYRADQQYRGDDLASEVTPHFAHRPRRSTENSGNSDAHLRLRPPMCQSRDKRNAGLRRRWVALDREIGLVGGNLQQEQLRAAIQ